MTEEQTTGIERVPYGLGKAIEAVKEAVPVEGYAGTLTDLRGSSGTLRGRCPLHKGESPDAFAVYPDKGRWWCFRCSEGGDVIDLCQAIEGGELWEAMFTLAQRFNVELPTRSEFWHTRQDEKSRTRDATTRYIAGVYQRRLTRLYAPLVLVGGETPEEELQEVDGLAASLWPTCLDMAGRRVRDE